MLPSSALSSSPASATDELEADLDRIIADCAGNARTALRVVLIANGFLEAEVGRLRASVSSGYVRGRISMLEHSDTMASGHSGER